jgi:hypothetical protein
MWTGPAFQASAPSSGRIEAIDFARGIAVALMILSHGVNGLLDFSQFPDWGMVPVHLVTKFSSTLFILVFGISLAVAFLPAVGTPAWPAKRKKLFLRGLVVFFWYKVLTIVEMIHLHEPADILDTLRYQAFPSYVEILGFYAIALIWVPLMLPIWKQSPVWLRIASPLALTAFALALSHHFHFWEIEALQAILVEHENHYAWGQLARGPLILLGLLLGQVLIVTYRNPRARRTVAGLFAAGSLTLWLVFYVSMPQELSAQLLSIAKNEGKHPPELPFMLFSIGGAFLILSVTLLGGERLAAWLRPITTIGKNALQAFIFHIFVIFIIFRYLLDYWHNISYMHALTLTVLLILATPVWIKTSSWAQAKP